MQQFAREGKFQLSLFIFAPNPICLIVEYLDGFFVDFAEKV
jgi:hypothetical protein